MDQRNDQLPEESPAGHRASHPGDAEQANQLHAVIARAKYEWECTADALTDLICLLDANGRVVRANRVVERWALGSVSAVLHRDVHSLLHAQCDAAQCTLARSLSDCWKRLQAGEASEFEAWDPVIARALRISLRPMHANGSLAQGSSLAVLVASDVTALHLAQESLRQVNEELEARVEYRTRELADANLELQHEVLRREAADSALRDSRSELALLSEQLMNAQEVERKRIAGELHDSVGQALSAIKYRLERAVELARQSRLDDPRTVLQWGIDAVQHITEDIRAIAMNLRPSMLDDLGAASAVAWFCRKFAQDYPLIELRADLLVDDGDVPERLRTAVFRSVQELLNNVANHAQAQRAVVSLHRENSSFVLEVEDDGVGLASTTTALRFRQGHGIRNLRERAEMTGGRFTLAPALNGKGTIARIEWRLSVAESSKESLSCQAN